MTEVAFHPDGNERLQRCWIDVQDHCGGKVYATVDRQGYVRHLCRFHFLAWRTEVKTIGGAVVDLGIVSARVLLEDHPDLYWLLVGYCRRWLFETNSLIEGIVGDVKTLAEAMP